MAVEYNEARFRAAVAEALTLTTRVLGAVRAAPLVLSFFSFPFFFFGARSCRHHCTPVSAPPSLRAAGALADAGVVH
jgi:hypothetical protein